MSFISIRRLQSFGSHAPLSAFRVGLAVLTCFSIGGFSLAKAEAQEATCPAPDASGDIVIPSGGSPHGPIDCSSVSDLTLVLEDGSAIESDTGNGLYLGVSAGGQISIETRPSSGSARIVSKFDETTADFDKAALSVFGGSSPSAGNLNIAVDDIWALGEGTDGLRIKSYWGNVNIKSKGSIRVGGSSPAFGIFVETEEANNAAYTTTLNIHDVTSEASDSSVDVAAVYVKSSGGIDVTSTGRIHTKGDSNHGIWVIQDVETTTMDDVSVVVNDVTTEGQYSYAVWVERLQFNAAATAIDVRVNGKVETFGIGSHGLALAGQGADVDIRVSETGSIIINERPPYEHPIYAVVVEKPDNNPVNSATLNNLGRIQGNIRMVSCVTPEFVNRGTFIPATSVELIKATCTPPGSGQPRGMLDNQGLLSFGSPNDPSKTTMTGDLVQSDLGRLMFDMDWEKDRTDFLEITGSASLGGLIAANLMSLPTGTQELAILSATEGISKANSLAVADTLLVDYELRQARESGVDTLYLSATFVTSLGRDGDDGGRELGDLNENQRNVLEEIVQSTPANDAIEDVLIDLAKLTEIEDLRLNLDRFGNEIAGAAIQSTFHATSGRYSALQHCEPRDSYALDRSCGWGVAARHKGSRERSWSQRGFSDTGRDLAGGTIVRFDDSGILAGFGFNHNKSRLIMKDISEADGENTVGEARLAGRIGRASFNLSATISSGSYDIVRHLPDNSQGSSSAGTLSNSAVGLRGGVKWTESIGSIELVPAVSIGHSMIKSDAYSEEGAGDLSLDVHMSDTSITTAGLATEFRLQPVPVFGMLFNPALSAGYNRTYGGTIRVNSDFKGGEGTYLSTTTLPSSTIEINFGGRLQSRSGRLLGTFGLQSVIARGKTLRRSAGANIIYAF